MDSSDVLKEYLIKVGVDADYDSLSKFGTIVGVIGKMAGGMAGALAAGIAGLEGFVGVATAELEDLYWATKRLKNAAQDIQDFQLRMQKAGATAESARSALETIAAFRRTNPAGDSLLGLIGVDARGKGAVEVMDQLIVRFKQLNDQGQYWLAVKFGERLGLDERTVFQMTQTVGKLDDKFTKMYKAFGLNADKAAERAHEFQNRLRDLKSMGLVLATVIADRLLPIADRFIRWLEDTIVAAADANSPVNALITNLVKAADDLSGLVKLMGLVGGMAVKLLGWMPPEALEFGVIGYFLFGKKAALVMAAIGAVSRLGDKLFGDNGNIRPEYVQAAGEDDRLDYRISRWFNDNGLGYLNSNDFNATYDEYKRRQRMKNAPDFSAPIEGTPNAPTAAPAAPPGGGRAPLGVRTNNPGNLRPGGKQATYKSAHEGLQAMAKLLGNYAQRGLTSIAQIINKYAPPNENNTQAYIATVARAMGVDPNAPLNLKDPATLQRLMSAMIKVENGYSPYGEGVISSAVRSVLGRAGGGAGGSGKAPRTSANTQQLGGTAPLGGGQGGKQVIVNQGDTNVTINNAKDPQRTGDQVKKVADRANGDLVRNFATAVI